MYKLSIPYESESFFVYYNVGYAHIRFSKTCDEWLHKNKINCYVPYNMIGVPYSTHGVPLLIDVIFDNEEDLILFKLTWI